MHASTVRRLHILAVGSAMQPTNIVYLVLKSPSVSTWPLPALWRPLGDSDKTQDFKVWSVCCRWIASRCHQEVLQIFFNWASYQQDTQFMIATAYRGLTK